MRRLYPLSALTLLLTSCDPGVVPDAGLIAANNSYSQALIVMLDCRNMFNNAMATISRSALHLTAQHKLEAVMSAYQDRTDCERRIDPILDEMRAGSKP